MSDVNSKEVFVLFTHPPVVTEAETVSLDSVQGVLSGIKGDVVNNVVKIADLLVDSIDLTAA